MIINSRIRLALHHLKTGVIAHPTDTVYGLGCLANNPDSIQKIIDLKTGGKLNNIFFWIFFFKKKLFFYC